MTPCLPPLLTIIVIIIQVFTKLIRRRFRFGAAGIGDGISTVGGGFSMAGFKGGGVALTTLGSGKMVA